MPRRCSRGIGALLFCLGTLTGCARVRSLNDPEARTRAAVEKLELGRAVRLGLAGGDTLEGTLVSRQWPDLSLHIEGSSQSLDARDIETIWTRGISKRKGQLAGAALGAVTFGVLFYLPTEPIFCIEGPDCGKTFSQGERVRNALIGTIPGVFLGGAIGTLVSRGTSEWQKIYP